MSMSHACIFYMTNLQIESVVDGMKMKHETLYDEGQSYIGTRFLVA
jgi:hypothetical protein